MSDKSNVEPEKKPANVPVRRKSLRKQKAQAIEPPAEKAPPPDGWDEVSDDLYG